MESLLLLFHSLVCTCTWGGWVHSAFAFCACACVFDFFLAAFMSEAKNDTTPKSFLLCSSLANGAQQ
jgi:hypothetical protein